MNLPSKVSSCLAVALFVAPLSHADAARLSLPHDLTQARASATGARAAERPAYATPSQIGSGNEATADPLVSRPNETPCVAVLFNNATFAQYAAETFAYAPPAGCPGPYNKIVFNANIGVTPGIQFDRTASVEIGNVPIYFGTTAEPNPTLGPTWHVERDVTDDAALLASPQTTEADIFNIVDSTYTGVITGTAFLQFYPARGPYRAAPVPSLVLPFPGVAGGPQHLNTGTSTLTATYTLPQNIDALSIDVYAQSQQTDEQYFNCAPNDVAAELYACGNGPFRETEISIDGVPAGVAPIYPWIFTGGLDPYLWAPIPGVQTLEFKPYRLDLTPFAGSLDDGKAHTITMSVDNADNYFQGFGTLFVHQDARSKRVTGTLTEDTLVANPVPHVSERLHGTSPSVDGTITTSLTRSYELSGWTRTAAGKTTTKVDSVVAFANEQTYSDESDTTGTLVVKQATSALERTTTAEPFGGVQTKATLVSFPLFESLDVMLDAAGTGTQVGAIDQTFTKQTLAFGPLENFFRVETNDVTARDTLDILDDEYITGNSNQSSAQRYDEFDTRGTCYSQYIAAAANILTTVKNGPCNAAADRAAAAALHR